MRGNVKPAILAAVSKQRMIHLILQPLAIDNSKPGRSNSSIFLFGNERRFIDKPPREVLMRQAPSAPKSALRRRNEIGSARLTLLSSCGPVTIALEETRALMFQVGTSNPGRGGVRKPARMGKFEDVVFDHLKRAGVKIGHKKENTVFHRIDRLADADSTRKVSFWPR